MSLADQKCIPCTGTIPPLEEEKIKKLLVEIHEDWSLNSLGHLQRSVQLANFNQAMKLANEIAEIAEQENHHPDIYVSWGVCKIEIWTHKIDGLTDSDFIFAAKVDRRIILTKLKK